MLKQWMKNFNKAEDAINLNGVDEEMSVLQTTGTSAELTAALDSVKTLSAQLAEATTALTDANTKITELNNIVQASKDMAALAEQKAAEAKLASRKEQIVLAVGTDKAEQLLEATKGMDDASFSAILGVVALTSTKEAESPLFKEAGVDGKTDATAPIGNGVADLLKAKYQTK